MFKLTHSPNSNPPLAIDLPTTFEMHLFCYYVCATQKLVAFPSIFHYATHLCLMCIINIQNVFFYCLHSIATKYVFINQIARFENLETKKYEHAKLFFCMALANKGHRQEVITFVNITCVLFMYVNLNPKP